MCLGNWTPLTQRVEELKDYDEEAVSRLASWCFNYSHFFDEGNYLEVMNDLKHRKEGQELVFEIMKSIAYKKLQMFETDPDFPAFEYKLGATSLYNFHKIINDIDLEFDMTQTILISMNELVSIIEMLTVSTDFYRQLSFSYACENLETVAQKYRELEEEGVDVEDEEEYKEFQEAMEEWDDLTDIQDPLIRGLLGEKWDYEEDHERRKFLFHHHKAEQDFKDTFIEIVKETEGLKDYPFAGLRPMYALGLISKCVEGGEYHKMMTRAFDRAVKLGTQECEGLVLSSEYPMNQYSDSLSISMAILGKKYPDRI